MGGGVGVESFPESARKRPQTKERACEEMWGWYGCLIKRDAFSHLLEKEGEKDKPSASQALWQCRSALSHPLAYSLVSQLGLGC